MKKIKLSDGRVVESYDPTVREFAKATEMEDGILKKGIASLSATIKVDGKKITVEQFKKDFRLSDFMKIQKAFNDIDIQEGKFSQMSNGKIVTIYDPPIGEYMERKEDEIHSEMYIQLDIICSMVKVDDKILELKDFLDNYHYSDYLKLLALTGELPKNA